MIAGPPSIADSVFDCLAVLVRKLSKMLQRKPPPKRRRPRRPSSKKQPRKALGPNRARTAKVLPFKRAANQ
jgi:hypothetical protein